MSGDLKWDLIFYRVADFYNEGAARNFFIDAVLECVSEGRFVRDADIVSERDFDTKEVTHRVIVRGTNRVGIKIPSIGEMKENVETIY